jgi:hypothetical protein
MGPAQRRALKTPIDGEGEQRADQADDHEDDLVLAGIEHVLPWPGDPHQSCLAVEQAGLVADHSEHGVAHGRERDREVPVRDPRETDGRETESEDHGHRHPEQ